MKNTRQLFLFFLLLLGLAVTAVSVAAHGDEILLRADPEDGAALAQSPTQVTTWFSNELDTSSTLQVFNLAGEPVDNGDGGVDLNDPDHATMIVSLPPLDEGVYLVQWTAVLLDGDTVSGAFTFGVGQAGAAASQLPAATAADTTAENSGGIPTSILIGAGIGAILIAGLIGFAVARSRQKA